MAESRANSHTVLIVDDHADTRALLCLSVQSKGYQVLEAANGQEAVELVSQVAPNLILMDLSMPVLDGYDATRKIKTRPESSHIPVVAISAFLDESVKRLALAVGCSEFIGKPVDSIVFGQVLSRYLA